MKSLSFDGLVELYDETRSFDKGCFDSALDYITGRFPPSEFADLFEPGIGTGRIAIPLAERGYRITGVDVSDEMLAVLRAKLVEPLPMDLRTADVTDLPFPEEAFDLAIVVHLFYFIADWKKAADEILRVVRRNGAVILMHTGTGMEVPFLNNRYKELCRESGCPIEPVGVGGTNEVIDHYAGAGNTAEMIRDRWQWTARIPLDKALRYLTSRAYSFTVVAPDGTHLSACEQLEAEVRQQFGDLQTEVEVPNQIYLVVVRRQ